MLFLAEKMGFEPDSPSKQTHKNIRKNIMKAPFLFNTDTFRHLSALTLALQPCSTLNYLVDLI